VQSAPLFCFTLFSLSVFTTIHKLHLQSTNTCPGTLRAMPWSCHLVNDEVESDCSGTRITLLWASPLGVLLVSFLLPYAAPAAFVHVAAAHCLRRIFGRIRCCWCWSGSPHSRSQCGACVDQHSATTTSSNMSASLFVGQLRDFGLFWMLCPKTRHTHVSLTTGGCWTENRACLELEAMVILYRA
jgi:hypothetical protein